MAGELYVLPVIVIKESYQDGMDVLLDTSTGIPT